MAKIGKNRIVDFGYRFPIVIDLLRRPCLFTQCSVYRSDSEARVQTVGLQSAGCLFDRRRYYLQYLLITQRRLVSII